MTEDQRFLGFLKTPGFVFEEFEHDKMKARNWGLVCGFGYGFAAATFAFLILLFVTAPHA